MPFIQSIWHTLRYITYTRTSSLFCWRACFHLSWQEWRRLEYFFTYWSSSMRLICSNYYRISAQSYCRHISVLKISCIRASAIMLMSVTVFIRSIAVALTSFIICISIKLLLLCWSLILLLLLSMLYTESLSHWRLSVIYILSWINDCCCLSITSVISFFRVYWWTMLLRLFRLQ